MSLKKVSISRTTGEWDKIKSKVKSLGKKDLPQYMRSSIYTLEKRIMDCEDCVTSAAGDKREWNFYISEESLSRLMIISKKMKKPVASVLDEFIINPLLID